jgi:cell wall-associated NlpC family hydrolase
VDVSVATVWASPSSPRALDRSALSNPVDVAGWTRGLTTSGRLGLVGRIETQALLGEPVRQLEQRGTWTKVAVVDQPTPKNPIGYPGWIPTRQLTSSWSFGRLLSGPIAVVTRPTAVLHGGVPRLELSYGTRLPALGRSGSDVLVATPAGPTARVPASAVQVYGSAAAIAAPTGNQLVATARLFLGLRYLWGGTSAFGFDCSGLVNLIYRAHGMVIPRDANAQALAGRPVLRRALQPGDLVFFATDPPSRGITHVSMYIGGGQTIESPDSAGAVHVIPLSDLTSQYVTARRYLGGS